MRDLGLLQLGTDDGKYRDGSTLPTIDLDAAALRCAANLVQTADNDIPADLSSSNVGL
jgi:hypothetical protein